MKKLLTLLLAAGLSLAASADNVKYMTFSTTDGQTVSLPIASGLTISFDNGKMVVVAGDERFSADISDMVSMWFDVEPTGIDTILNSDLADGTVVRVFGMDGRLVTTYRHGLNARPELPTGTYVICAGKKSAKVLVK